MDKKVAKNREGKDHWMFKVNEANMEKHFPNNQITTSKYTCLSFLPK